MSRLNEYLDRIVYNEVAGTGVGIGNARLLKNIKNLDKMTPEDQKEIMKLTGSNEIAIRTGDDQEHREIVRDNNYAIKQIELKYMSDEEKDKEIEKKLNASLKASRKRIEVAKAKSKTAKQQVALKTSNYKDEDIIKEIIFKLYQIQTRISADFKQNIKWMKKGSPQRIKAFKDHKERIYKYEDLIQELRTKFNIKESKTSMKSDFTPQERKELKLHLMLPNGVEELFKKYKINLRSFY